MSTIEGLMTVADEESQRVNEWMGSRKTFEWSVCR